jgi:predicted adenine nucleotide alpha hydrolase (AANH) superfamily ATPase
MEIIPKSLLVHVCCAPCLSGLTDYFKSLGFEKIMAYFYNPNIHPYKEFKQRRHHVRSHEKFFGFDEFEYSDDYPLDETLRGMLDASDRCEYCFHSRLQKVALKAIEKGYSHFTTTLLISPYQKQELLIKIGNEIAEKYGLNFLGEDLTRFYDHSRDVSKEKEMYRQGYCGCIFSEFERYGSK